MPPPPFDAIGFSAEILFTLLAAVFCALIYWRTRESYELTKHRGIKYFRDAFLLFGISYVLRLLFSAMRASRFVFDIGIPRELFMVLFILPLGYVSTLGIMALISSTIWRRFSDRTLLLLSHTVAIVCAVVPFFFRSHWAVLYLQAGLLIIAIVSIALMKDRRNHGQPEDQTPAKHSLQRATKNDEKKRSDRTRSNRDTQQTTHGLLSQTKLLYLLVAGLWLLSLLSAGGGRPMRGIDPAIGIWIEPTIQLVSLIVFFIVYRKVSKWTA
jgi:hypothetical protein